MKICFLIFLCSFCFVGHTQVEYNKKKTWNYPLIKPDTVIEDFYGSKIIDPYRNIEFLNVTTVKLWYKKQKLFYDSVVLNITNRDIIEEEIKNYKDQRVYWSEIPRSVGDKLFFTRYNYKDRTITLNYKPSFSSKPIELFNLDSINKADGIKYDIDYFEPSRGGEYVAFALSYGGNENSCIYILDVESKKLLVDSVPHAMGGNPQWLPGNKGFVYQKDYRYKTIDGENVRELSVNIHYLGTNSDKDKEILSKRKSTQIKIGEIDFPLVFLSNGSEYILAAIHRGTETNPALYFSPLKEVLTKSPEKINWVKIFNSSDHAVCFHLIKNQLYYLSFKENPNGIVYRTDIFKPDNKKKIFEGGDIILESMILNRNSIYINGYKNNVYELIQINLKNEKLKKIDLPYKGSVLITPSFRISDFFQNSDDFYFKFLSWNRSQCILKCGTNSDSAIITNLIPQNEYSYLKNIKIETTEVISHDSTLVPLTIFYDSILKLNGQNPVIIEAYGCYGYSYSPYFRAARKAWLDRGGIFAIAHVRGGGEKGEEWYKGGFKATKSNSWKDLIACTGYLIDKKYSSSAKIAAIGTSCGGIAVGRAITERPDLFKAAIISVGTLNTLRHEQEVSKGNIAEYGTIKDSTEFQYLYNMDVYHHIQKGIEYPSVIITSGMNDARIAPWHGGKTVAKLQETNNGNNIVLYYISEQGHSRFSETADSYAFLLWQFGHPDFKLEYNNFIVKP